MHGPPETQPHEDVSFHGEVWTDPLRVLDGRATNGPVHSKEE